MLSKHRFEKAALENATLLGGEVAAELNDEARALAAALTDLAHAHVPGVLVIEDLHLMSPSFAEFLDAASQRRGAHPVLVIGTAWPEGENNAPYTKWRSRTELQGNVEIWDMPDLEPKDLQTLLRRYAPDTSDHDAAQIAARYPNPLTMELFCTLNETQERISASAGRLIVSELDMSRLPFTLQALYEARWSEMSRDVQDALALASGAIPNSMFSWRREPITAIISRAVAPKVLGLHVAMAAAQDPYHWTTEEQASPSKERFVEPILYEIATSHLTQGVREKMLHSTRSWLGEQMDALRDDDQNRDQSGVRLEFAEWLTAFTRIHGTKSATEAEAVFVTAQALADAHQFRAAVARVEGPYLALMGFHEEGTLIWRNQRALWLGLSGQLDNAIAEFEALLRDCEGVLGTDDSRTRTVRLNIAASFVQAGRPEEAIEPLISLVEGSTARWGASHPETLALRRDLTLAWGESGQVERAVGEAKEIAQKCQESLGPLDPATLQAQSDLGRWVGEAGHYNRAIAILEGLLPLQIEALGAEDPSTFITRSNLAFWIGESGDPERCLRLFQELLEDQLRLFGPEHPETLGTRNNVASWTGRVGDASGAVLQFGELLEAQFGLLGATHPDTLATRNNLGYWIGKSGDTTGTVQHFEDLVADLTVALGDTHPQTLTARMNLGYWIGDSGDPRGAAKLFKTLASDCAKVMGPQHPVTLGARANLAWWIAQSGQLRNAVRQLVKLVAECDSILGSGHSTTLACRQNLDILRSRMSGGG
ncbi:tetratricopeptide repeat protein [Terrabacter carboxydivorans]|uniref:Tetratricopeptide repeat protein n=1 Tax=Terrabacter carboxydivorans TaxID=619730 RepID=A0ABN3LZW9_9MICO